MNIIRGTPAFLQIYIAFFGLPLAGVKVDEYVLGVIVMAMNSSAYLCEIFRAGIQSIPKGQNEAARSLGMNAFQTLLYVMIPQTFRNVLPTLTSEFILLYKDTSLLAAVGVVEIVMNARTIVATTGSITEAEVISCADFSADKAAGYDAIAFGCPAMGSEELEYDEFQPMWDEVKETLGDKKVVLFGSYSWAEGEWMDNWKADADEEGVNVVDSVICYDAPDDESEAACRALGAELA